MKLIACAAVAALALFACGSAKNTPEQAFADLKLALEQSRWDLLYDILPPDQQQAYGGSMAKLDASIRAAVAQFGATKAADAVEQQYGYKLSDWEAARDERSKFAVWFAPVAPMELGNLGVSKQIVLASGIKEVDIRGDKATLLLDDGRGHRSKLSFKLVGDTWRFSLGEKS